MNSQRDHIILKSNQLNSACQALGLAPPKRLELSFATQIIPTLIIGQLHFIAPNWLCSKDEKLVRLIDFVLNNLNNTEFLENNIHKLKGSPLHFENVFCNDSIQPFIRETLQKFP